MNNYLLIVESPSKIKKIEEFLGKDYKCIASCGHICNIQKLKDIDIQNNFKINYSIIEEKKKNIEKMRNIISTYSYENIYLATDDDNEGEGISYHICKEFNLPLNKTKRIIFHEITECALKKAVETPTTINMNIVNSYFARQITDIFIGYKISPLLWKKIFSSKDNKALSAGRVQSPALRLVYESDIQQNIPIEKYKINGYFVNKGLKFVLNGDFICNNYSQEPQNNDIIKFLEKSKTHNYDLLIKEPNQSIKTPPVPFNTSQLLQISSNVLHCSPKETMFILQELYQDGKITYMRTENTKYCVDFLNNIKKYITEKYCKDYIGDLSLVENKDINKPHEAIRPTNINNQFLDCDDKNSHKNKLYHLIWKNTIESCMSIAKYSNTLIEITAPDNLYYKYTIEIPLFLGWKAIEEKTSITEEQNIQTGILNYFKNLKMSGSIINYNYIECILTVENQTNKHYTEAGLIQQLEKLGIGRPSTYASILSTILDKNYVKKTDIKGEIIKRIEYKLIEKKIEQKNVDKLIGNEKNKLVIQPIGRLVIDFLIENFNNIISYNYTGKMEEQLDLISSGNYDKEWFKLCENCNNDLTDTIKKIKIEKTKFTIDEEHDLIFTKNGPTIKQSLNDGEIIFKNVNKNLKIDIEKLKNGEYKLDDLIEIKNIFLGEYKGEQVLLKNGKYGLYTVIGDKNYSIKNINKNVNEITINDIINFLTPKTNDILAKPVLRTPINNPNILRYINSDLSIRKGKLGPYLYYKTDFMNKPDFYSLKSFRKSFSVCSEEDLFEWIRKYTNIQI